MLKSNRRPRHPLLPVLILAMTAFPGRPAGSQVALSADPAMRCGTLPSGPEGIEACREAIKADSTDAYVYFNMANRFVAMGLEDSVPKYIRKSVYLNPAYGKSQYMLARSSVPE